jgi:hypothetical protein
LFPPEEIKKAIKDTGYIQYQADPIGFGERILGETFTDDVKKLMESVRDNPITLAKPNQLMPLAKPMRRPESLYGGTRASPAAKYLQVRLRPNPTSKNYCGEKSEVLWRNTPNCSSPIL